METAPRANLAGSMVCLAGIVLTGLTLNGAKPEQLASYAAIGTGLSLLVSIVADARVGLQNLARTDLMALMAFYFLTFVEFLFPQSGLLVTDLSTTRKGVVACLVAYAGLVIGRHLVKQRRHPFAELCERRAPNAVIFSIFWVCFVVGYLYMLMAVNFDVAKMLDYFLAPRFTQPWGRGRLGDWKALLVEVAAVINLVPPLGGILIARRRQHSKVAIWFIIAAVLFTFFYGFTTGTRNLFAAFLVMFLIGYCFAVDWTRQKRELIWISATVIVALFISTKLMLDFRTIGLKNYIKGRYYTEWQRLGEDFSVDNNLAAVCGIVSYFPQHHAYLGWEVPYVALVHPIPRALWSGKPEKMSVSVEEILNAEGWTISTTFVGEAFMMGGFLAVFGTALAFGALFAWWDLLASPRNSEFGILVYASGFAAAVISMRSLQWLSTTILPTIGGVIAGRLLIKGGKKVVATIRARHGAKLQQRLAQQAAGRNTRPAPQLKKPLVNFGNKKTTSNP